MFLKKQNRCPLYVGGGGGQGRSGPGPTFLYFFIFAPFPNWLCDSCKTKIDSNSHVTWCVAYRELREGKDLKCDKDLAEYLKKVMLIRDKLNLTR